MDGQIRKTNFTADEALAERRCWVCGDVLSQWLGFPLPATAVLTRRTSDPPCHPFCAEWSIHPCPGVVAVWVTRSYRRVGTMLTIGPAERIEWWIGGRPATRTEVAAAVVQALLVLRRQLEPDGQVAVEQLEADACLLVARFLPVK